MVKDMIEEEVLEPFRHYFTGWSSVVNVNNDDSHNDRNRRYRHHCRQVDTYKVKCLRVTEKCNNQNLFPRILGSLLISNENTCL